MKQPIILCLGSGVEVYGPFKDDAVIIDNWLTNHVSQDGICSNGIDRLSHQVIYPWPYQCRICGIFLDYDRDNHPENPGLCWRDSDRVEEVSLGIY